MPSPCGSARPWRRSPGSTRCASRSPKCRRGRRSYRPWWAKSTGRRGPRTPASLTKRIGLRRYFLKTRGVVDVDTSVETAGAPLPVPGGPAEGGLERLEPGPDRPGPGHGRGRGDGGPGPPGPGAPAPGDLPAGPRGLALLHPEPGPALLQESPGSHGALAGTGAVRPGPGPQIHHAEKPGKGGVRHRGHRRAKPGERHPRPDGGHRQNPAAAGLPGQLCRGGRVEDHGAGFPGLGDRLCRGPGGHLHPAGAPDLVVHHAPGDHGGHPADHDRGDARVRPA